MPDEDGKSAAQAFGIIPNVYFDLIARVIPGCLFLFLLCQVSSENPIKTIIDDFMPYDKLRESTSAWILVIVSAGYIIGHAFAPIVRYLEEPPAWAKRMDSTKSRWLHVIARFFLPPFWTCSETSKSFVGTLQKDYNKLRYRNPTLAALAIRIRAEYTMYGGIAVALATTLLIAGLHLLEAAFHHRAVAQLQGMTSGNWLLLAIGIIGVPLMLRRHLHTWERFGKTVRQLLEASEETTM